MYNGTSAYGPMSSMPPFYTQAPHTAHPPPPGTAAGMMPGGGHPPGLPSHMSIPPGMLPHQNHQIGPIPPLGPMSQMNSHPHMSGPVLRRRRLRGLDNIYRSRHSHNPGLYQNRRFHLLIYLRIICKCFIESVFSGAPPSGIYHQAQPGPPHSYVM